MKKGAPSRVADEYLLDGNLLVALADSAHVHHDAAVKWFLSDDAPFATCPITQGTLVRMLLQFQAVADVSEAVSFLDKFTAHPKHRFWPDSLPYVAIPWKGVLGHAQVTDAYLNALARHHGGRITTFDKGLAALHADTAELLVH